jgi:hypothetical protein
MRWDPAFFCGGDRFTAFWATMAGDVKRKRHGLLIAGRGFDPRTTEGPRAIAISGMPIGTCCLLRLVNEQDSTDRPRNLAAATNESAIAELFESSAFEVRDVSVRDTSGRIVGSSRTRALFAESDWLGSFTDVIVDITALPTSIWFPLLGSLIASYDELASTGRSAFNLHCIVCENADLDQAIMAEGGDVADYIDPFRGTAGLAAQAEPITIWAPALGERQAAALRKIYDMLRPHETKPFLPFPSREARRGDELVAEYQSLLFDTWEVDPRGYLYADERDPFDIYRQIGDLAAEYRRSLAPLGVANTVVSTHTSKLLSLGVFLAAFEHTLAVAHVEPTGYSLDEDSVKMEANELFEVWLTGEAYVAS